MWPRRLAGELDIEIVHLELEVSDVNDDSVRGRAIYTPAQGTYTPIFSLAGGAAEVGEETEEAEGEEVEGEGEEEYEKPWSLAPSSPWLTSTREPTASAAMTSAVVVSLDLPASLFNNAESSIRLTL